MNGFAQWSGEQAIAICTGAKIVAIRWDVLPWCLVLDLDAPVDEGSPRQRNRAWVVFEGVSNMTLDLRGARVPLGIHVSSAAQDGRTDTGMLKVVLQLLAPELAEDGSMIGEPLRRLEIWAQSVVGIVSREAAMAGDYGLLDMARRSGLASDEECAREAVKMMLKVTGVKADGSAQ